MLNMNSQALYTKKINPYYILPTNIQIQNNPFNASSNQVIYSPNISSQQMAYNNQGQKTAMNFQRKEALEKFNGFVYNNHKISNYQYNNSFGNSQESIGNNIKNETIVVPLSNTKYIEPKITDPEKKIKIIIKDKYSETEMEFKKDTKFSEVHSLYTEKHYLWSDVYKYVFNEKIIDLNKTLDELCIYNNSKICIYDEDIQDILIMGRPLSNGNISEEEK